MAIKPSVTIVIPCLDEAKTLPVVLQAIRRLRQGAFKGRAVEVLVSDNGSSDGSQAIARRLGARVVPCAQRGYGAALQNGIRAAKHDTVVFADADATYDFLETPRLVERLERGYDMVVGSRLAGKIHPGAMPFSHRWLGTPILTWLINRLYGGRLSDCNSGFRCFSRRAFLSWGVHSQGMEFASEMLVKALRCGARVAEEPVSLHADTRGRPPHLRRWRDGMRHLLQILREAPWALQAAGGALTALGWCLLLASAAWGLTAIGPVKLLGPHTQLFALLMSWTGVLVWSMGLFLCAAEPNAPAPASYRWALGLGEEKVFWVSAAALLACAGLVGAIVLDWALHGFGELALERQALLAVALSASLFQGVIALFTGHLLKGLPRKGPR
jgi:hypothetical protein